MSDWEVVGGNKKKPSGVKSAVVSNGGVSQPIKQQNQYNLVAEGTVLSPKREGSKKSKKYLSSSKKPPAPFPLFDEEENEPMSGIVAVGKEKSDKKGSGESSKKNKNPPQKQTNAKQLDLESAIKKVSPDEIYKFFEDLKKGGGGGGSTDGDVYLSWIKYTANALNNKLNNVIPPTPNQWLDLKFPNCPKHLEDTIRRIIKETIMAVPFEDKENTVMNVAFSNILQQMPTLILRGDPGYGYLIFLREFLRMSPDLAISRYKSFIELMESYGNRKEIGLTILWVVSQAALGSPNKLYITLTHILPYYSFKNYKNFVLAALEEIFLSSSCDSMGVETFNVEPDEFEEFFEASFDPKKKREFEKFYPRVKDITLRNLKGEGSQFFSLFLKKISDKEFNSSSPYGREVLSFIHGCLENDSTSIDTWKSIVGKYSKESIIILNFLVKNVENIHCQKILEKNFIQSDEFAIAAVKYPELLRSAKKLQSGIKRVEASKSKFSWTMASFILLITIVGILFLDIHENGQGKFEKSNTGLFLKKYELYDSVMIATNTTISLAKSTYALSSQLFRACYERIRPLLQTINQQVQIYIPTITKYLVIASDYASDALYNFSNFMTENVFVGALSPENMRKMAKDGLTIVWTNVYMAGQKGLELIEGLIETYYSGSSTGSSSSSSGKKIN